GGQFSGFAEQVVNFAAFNDVGDIAFSAATTNPAGSGIWVSPGAGGPLSFVAGTGTPAGAAMPGVTFAGAGLAGFNNSKQFGIRAFLQGPGVTPQNDESLWRMTGSSLELVAREGQAIPGTGLTIDSTFGAVFGSATINGKRTMAFGADVGTGFGIFTAD